MLRGANERPNSYASPAILARRRRILEETRRVIAEEGIGALSMNDIGLRAGVAKRTLYNAFQTRERMIAAAIQEFFEEYVGQVRFKSVPGTLMYTLERVVSTVRRSSKVRNYISAAASLYFSADLDHDVWAAMHSLSMRYSLQWLEAAAHRKQLQPWVEPRKLADDLARFEFATLNEWVQGRIADEEIALRLVMCHLTILQGVARGQARREIEQLLKDVSTRGLEALPMAPGLHPVRAS